MKRNAFATALFGLLAYAVPAEAGADPDLVGFVDLPLPKCSTMAATGQAAFDGLARTAEIGAKEKPLLREFGALNKKSTATGNHPMYIGLSARDNTRAVDISRQIKRQQFLLSVEDAYERDMLIVSRMFVDVEGESETGTPPSFDASKPNSDANQVYGLALAMRKKFGAAPDPKPTANLSRCSVDLALWQRESEPLQRLNDVARSISGIQSRLASLHATYGSGMLDPTIMSPQDRATYEQDRDVVASIAKAATFVRDLEDLRLLVKASGLRRQSYIHDLLVSSTDIDIGGTLRVQKNRGDFDNDKLNALGFQDLLSSMFPTWIERSLATQPKAAVTGDSLTVHP